MTPPLFTTCAGNRSVKTTISLGSTPGALASPSKLLEFPPPSVTYGGLDARPQTKCFAGDVNYATFASNTILTRSYDFASNLSIPEARKRLVTQHKEADALYQTQFHICGATMGEQLRYMGTSTVARDIDFITTQLEGPDALMSVVSLLTIFVTDSSSCSNFYGFSYGTILGMYLVNMSVLLKEEQFLVCLPNTDSIDRFPDKVGRVAIDGVADATAWSCKFPDARIGVRLILHSQTILYMV